MMFHGPAWEIKETGLGASKIGMMLYPLEG